MQIVEGTAVYSVSDLINDLECEHLTRLEMQLAQGALTAPEKDASLDLIARKGNEHEQRYLEELRIRHNGDVIELPAHLQQPRTRAQMAEADAATAAAMARGAAVIYQAVFFDGVFLGRADFLQRVETPSEFFPWSYEVHDTKLALHLKANVVLQLVHYNDQLTRLQGRPAEYGYVILGSGEVEQIRLRDFAAYYRYRRNHFLSAVALDNATYPSERAFCSTCRWSTACDDRRDADDDLSIIANIRGNQIAKLTAAGITTVAALAHAPAGTRPHGMSETSFATLQAQAALQHLQRTAPEDDAHPYRYEFVAFTTGAGFEQLPVPHPGDIYFDIEGDPIYAADHGLEYLFGFWLGTEKTYRPFWALSAAEERGTFEAVMDFMTERHRQFPGMHIYHYAPYEITALRRLAGRYGTRENELDALLRSLAFVDLYTVVRQAVRISQPSYSIKKIEPFYGMTRSTDVKRGDDSIVQFELWLQSKDDGILRDIEKYNDDDCRSTGLLRDWLLERRAEFAQLQGIELAWRQDPAAPEAGDTPDQAEAGPPRPSATLLDGIEAPVTAHALRELHEATRARWLLGNLVQYHRREAKPAWWKIYDRCANIDQLVEFDHEAVGGLVLDHNAKPYPKKPRDRNLVYTYDFPEQQHNVGSEPFAAHLIAKAGEIVEIGEGRLQIKLTGAVRPNELRALVPGKPVDTKALRDGVLRIADAFPLGADTHVDKRRTAVYDVLLARPPRLREHPSLHAQISGGGSGTQRIQPDDLDPASILAVIERLDSSYMVIQGPPGTGKSTKSAAMILALIEQGRRVAVMSGKHKAVHHLLHKIEALAERKGVQFRGLYKYTAGNLETRYESPLEHPNITACDTTAAFAADHVLAGGTQWHFANEAFENRYDYLFIDEAGQVALADALACIPAAKNVVLLGDPLQLAHVSQGEHPLGTGVSVLEHLLGEQHTISPERGIFLDTSYRMTPRICDFISEAVYEGRLKAAEQTHGNRVESPGPSGHGLRYRPVAHHYNMRASHEEASAIATDVGLLLQGRVVVGGVTRQMTPADILIVTPYNAQRKVILDELAARFINGVAVGTVDKFQGLEAPVVFYSMATSSGDDIPRDLEFLFERNRLNVAISRAQCLAILVCSPKLLDVACGNTEEMALVNTLCELVERCEGTAK